MFKTRSQKLERIDTGDYTSEEYERFLREIRFVNTLTGDKRALRKTLFREIKKQNLGEFSVLDVGAGSGEILRETAKFARKRKINSKLIGLDLNTQSIYSILEESKKFSEIKPIQADALNLPFDDKSIDFAVSTLFTHHLSDEQIVKTLSELKRVVRRKIFITDLHRHRFAYLSYKIFCTAFRISPLVREDGLLSILRAFRPDEFSELAIKAGLKTFHVRRIFPFRLVLEID